MYRIQLVSYKGLLLSPDTAQAVEQLTAKASDSKWLVELHGPTPGLAEGSPRSLIPAGREIWFRFVPPAAEVSTQNALNAAWSHAIPMGFTPWLRHPLEGPGDTVFHFFGPWMALYERLLSEGRGHLAWPSVCAAAQCDVGAWKGDHQEERFVQAQLHRVGRNCGPVDGVIGPRTSEVIDSLGLKRATFSHVLEYLRTAEVPQVPTHARRVGHVAFPGHSLNIATFGGIKAVKTPQGATLTYDGPGRVVLDVGGVE